MTVDKEHLDQPASKSAIFTPPSLTNFGDPMSAPTRTGNRPDADQPVAKSKLILPTAIWVLIVVGSLCFLSLLASLNKSINTLDSLVEIEQASAGKRRGEAPDSPSSKFGDLISLPSWLSLDRPSTREPSVEGIIITGGGPLPLGLDNQLGEPSDPVAAMVRDLFGAGPTADQAYDQLPAEPAPSSLIDKININRLNININPKPQSDHGAERTQMLAQRRPFRPQEFAGPDSLGPNRMLDDMLIKMIGAPLDEQRREPVPMSPLAQLHLMPFEPELSREGMRPHSQLDSSIPPMFGRPNGEAHIVITQIGGPEPDSGASPVETSSTERPSTNESSTLGDLVTPEPIVAVQQPVTSQPEEADDEPRRGANRVTDLFKMFFGPPPTTKFFAMPPYVEKFEEKPSNANEAEINEALKETIEPKVTTTAASTDGSPMEQLFDGLLGGTISLPQMASEQPAIKVGSADGKETTPSITTKVSVAPLANTFDVLSKLFKSASGRDHTSSSPEYSVDNNTTTTTNGDLMVQTSPKNSNHFKQFEPSKPTEAAGSSQSANNQETHLPVSPPTDTMEPTTTTAQPSSTAASTLEARTTQTSPTVTLGVDLPDTTRKTSSVDSRLSGSSSSAPFAPSSLVVDFHVVNSTRGEESNPSNPSKTFFQRADEFIERNISRFRKLLH